MFASKCFTRLLVLLCLGTSLAFGQLTYNTTTLPLSGEPTGLAAADFDRNGLPDVAIVQHDTLSIFFNQGGGNFSASHDTALAANSVSVQAIAADVNNDGKIDIVIAQSQPTQIIILLGNGDGSFQSPIILPLVNTPGAIALGDLNNDGKVDLAVRECPINSSSCDIAVYLGSGTGTFTPDTVLSAPGTNSFTRNLVVTDFNKDGKLDIATAALSGSSSTPTTNFSAFFGNGDGTFGSPVVVQVPFSLPANSSAQPPSIVYGDFNGDAVDDLGVETGSICGSSACGESQMNIFLSNATGGFALHSQFTTRTDEGPNNWTAGDLDNDLKIDLTRISNNFHTPDTQTWLNDGSANFMTVSNPFQSFSPAYAEIRDLNLDGRHDLVEALLSEGGVKAVVGFNQNGTPNCPPPPSNILQAKMCSPGSTTSSNTFTVQGSGNSPVGIKRVELWVDGHKVAQTLNDQLRKTLTLSTGTHSITVVAVDKYIGFAKATRSVNVQ